MKAKPARYLLLGILALLAMIFMQFVDRVPPRSLTDLTMHMMKRRMLRYAAANGSLPTSLAQLPQIQGYHSADSDGWGRLILWQVEEDNVILTSYGRDGVPGGGGEDADIVGVFRARTTDGSWADEMCEWRVDPVIRE